MATTTNYGWTTPDDTALVKDGASAIRSLGTAIDTTVFNNAGAAIAKTLIDAKGDLIVGSAADTAARLAAGTNGYLLSANSGATNGLEWVAPAAGGKVLQVVEGTLTGSVVTTSTSYADTGLTVSITPSAATSKVLVFAVMSSCTKGSGNAQNFMKIKLLRDSTTIFEAGDRIAHTQTNVANDIGSVQLTKLDSPNTTSSTTYKVQFASNISGQNSFINDYETSNTTISTIIAMEIGA